MAPGTTGMYSTAPPMAVLSSSLTIRTAKFGFWLAPDIPAKLMVAIGVLAVGSTRDVNYRRVVIIRWVGALLSLVVAVITGWSFGLVFVPGAVLLLLAALRTRPQSA